MTPRPAAACDVLRSTSCAARRTRPTLTPSRASAAWPRAVAIQTIQTPLAALGFVTFVCNGNVKSLVKYTKRRLQVC
jgi:hypothetical protein